jgi:lambda family phage tail tape measure protein
MALNTTRAQVQINATVSGTSQVAGLTQTINGTTSSVAQLTRQQQALQRQIDNLTQTVGKSRSEILQWKANAAGMGDSLGPAIDNLRRLGIDGGHAMNDLSFKTAGAKRELLVLMHEASQGNWTKFGGSLMVLGERINVMTLLFSATGATIIGVVAALGGLVVAFAKGASESSAFAHSMEMTGTYAGITEDRFNALAHAIGEQFPGGIHSARAALQELISTGSFTSENLLVLGKDVELLAHLSGESSDKIVADFAKMSTGVAKWAEEHNRQYHFITAAQYAYIVALEEQGRTEEAEKVVADALYKHLGGDAVQNLGLLEQAWHGVRDAIGDAVDALKGFGRAETTGQQIAKMLAKKSGANSGPTLFNDYNDGADVWSKDDEAKLDALRKKFAQEQADAQKKSADDQTQQKGIAGIEALRSHWRNMAGDVNRADEEIKRFHRDLDAALKANPNDKDALDAQAHAGEIEAAIRKRDEKLKKPKVDHSGQKLENAYQTRRQSLTDDGGKLDSEIAQVERFGKVLDASRLAVLNLDIAQGKLKGLSSDQIATLRALAGADDAKQQALASAKAFQGGEARAKQIAAEAQARTVSNREAQVAVEMAQVEQQGLAKTSARYQQLEKDIRAAVNAREDANLASTLQQQSAATDVEVAKLEDETVLMRKNSLARQQLIADMKIQAEAAKLIVANPDQAAQIQADADARKAKINGALEDNYNASRSSGQGQTKAFQDYIDQSTDAATQVQKLWGDTFKGTADAMETFLEGGKVDFKAFADSIIKDLLRMALQQTVMAPLLKLIGAGLGVGGGGGQSINGPGVQVGAAPTASITTTALPFANGGVFGPGGSVPLTKYATGGVAKSPQLALFGEGSHNEAYVPLPDGRSIPVSMKGNQQQGGHTIQTNVTVNSDGSSAIGGDQQGKRMAEAVKAAVTQELMRQQRDGGMFSSTRNF